MPYETKIKNAIWNKQVPYESNRLQVDEYTRYCCKCCPNISCKLFTDRAELLLYLHISQFVPIIALSLWTQVRTPMDWQAMISFHNNMINAVRKEKSFWKLEWHKVKRRIIKTHSVEKCQNLHCNTTTNTRIKPVMNLARLWPP